MTEAEYAEKHYPLIRFIARRVARFNHEDLAQIGMIAALEMFRQQQDTPATALTVCVARRAMIHAIRSENCKRRGGELERAAPREIAGETRPEQRNIERIDLERALGFITHEKQRQVIAGTLHGYTMKELAEAMCIPMQSVFFHKRNAIRRIRRALYLTA
jgi:RNA polymerase sigma factor (sigma-70 family)